MDSLKSMNMALDYIENYLTEEIDYNEVAKIALCSEYHFKRMFSFLAGVSLSEYVRRRRMTLAAQDLKQYEERVLDIAVKYGYNSADAFSRAFQQIHGILPSEVKGNAAMIKAYPKLTFKLSISGGIEMNYRIVEKEAFKIIGFMKRVPIVFSGVNPEIASIYQRLTPEIIQYLKGLSNVEPKGIISASTHFSEERMEEKGELDHYIGVATTKFDPNESSPISNSDILDVEKGTWAVFESIGPFPETLQEIWGRIYSEWFPASIYEACEGPEIVWHESPDTTNPNYKSEIWVKVKQQMSK
jgi:AraC family transcriptional regulator